MNRSPIAVLALAGTLASAAAVAQAPAPRAVGAAPKAAPVSKAASAPKDPQIAPASTAAALTPTPFDQIKAPSIPLPEEPIEPFLLTKANGPFMVLAKTFRGPEAEQFALALALELRNQHGLPAYILRTKDFPNRSNIRNVPPTAPSFLEKARLTPPERVRSYDEAAVLVGDEKTEADAMKLLHRVKKIQPQCLKNLPAMYIGHDGLKRAMRTINPYVPAQNLFPAKRDNLVYQMNQGPYSLYRCPGRYSLEIADFSGRSTFDVEGPKALSLDSLKKSPLATAADDAEKLADALRKAPEITQTGQQVYVYHSRTASKVMIGSFDSPDDPKAAKLREYLLKNTMSMMDTKDAKTGRPLRNRGIDKLIVPAGLLTDIEPLKPH